MNTSWRTLAGAAVFVAAVAGFAPAALTQAHGPPNALQGFTKNRGQPIQIESATLEVRDKEKQATFTDNVRLVQGDTTLECRTLVVHYEDDAQPSSSRRRQQQGPSTNGGQQIKRLEAKGGVVVTQKDQTATGDRGIYDIKSNSVTLIGNVVVTQGPNVLRGDRLVVDMTSGVSRVESNHNGTSRVQGLFNSGPREQKPPEAAAAPKPTRAEKPRTATTGEKPKGSPAKPPRS